MKLINTSGNYKLKHGFTLIELLVVIAIIGILTTFATFAYQDSQAKSRDTRRKANLETIKKALELAKQDSAGGYSYPRCDGLINYSPAGTGCPLDNTRTTPDLAPASGVQYLKSVPNDPKSNSGYVYLPAPSGCGVGACVSFSLVACLENTKDTQKDATSISAVCPASTGTVSHTITN